MRILIVEDNKKLADSLKKGFSKNGYATDCIYNGEEAADRIIMNHSEYDVIILDLMLPGRSGSDITVAVRERDISTSIIVLTAADEVANKLTLLDSGADDYMVKPFSFDELLARVRAVLRRPHESVGSGNEIIFEDLRMVMNQHKVFCNNKEVTLTNKEFAILELFARNKDKVLDREFILDHVWDYNFNSLSNVVDVHVKNLRKKLEETGSCVKIETVSGVGYRANPEV